MNKFEIVSNRGIFFSKENRKMILLKFILTTYILNGKNISYLHNKNFK